MGLYKDIKAIILPTFPEEWLDDKTLEDLQEAILPKIEIINNKIFDLFCKSLLSGEYILKSDKSLRKNLKKIIAFVESHFDDIGDSAEIQEFLNRHIKIGSVNFVKTLVYHYKEFLANISLITTHPFQEVSFSLQSDQMVGLELEAELLKTSNLFRDYYLVQIQDQYFNDEEDIFRNISILLNRLQKSTTPSKYTSSLIEKLRYLKHKWILRQLYYSKNDEDYNNKGYIDNGEVKAYFNEDKFIPQHPKHKEWLNYLDSHYELSDQPSNDIKKLADRCKEKDFENLKLTEIHCLIKYYKDIQPSANELENISNKLIEKYKNRRNLKDRSVHKKSIIYSLNNLFSLLLETDVVNLKKVETIHAEIEKYQEKFNITNYFADKKLITYKLNVIEKAFNNREILNNFENESEELENLRLIIERCDKRMIWSFKHHSLIFQLPYKESLVKTRIKGIIGIYYASTFVLPIPQQVNIKEFRKIKDKFEKLSTLSNLISSLKPEFIEVQDVKSDLKSTQEDLKNNDFRSVEIIGIFTAIVTFVITSIPSFKFIDSFEKAIYFYAVLGSSLTTMILTLFLVRKGSEAFSRNWIALMCLFILLLCGLVLIQNI